MEPEQVQSERRTSRRLDMEKELITVNWEDNGTKESSKPICLDVSSTGLKINIDRPIQTNTKAEIIFEGKDKQTNTFSAEVVYCNLQENGWYEIAFQFTQSGESV